MKPTVPSEPTLEHLRSQFASGDINGTRRALLQLSPAGRSELASRVGDATFRRMTQASRGLRGSIEGRVVVIHGIMGGKLAVVDSSGDEDLVWVNLLRLAAGRIGDFALDPDGNSADPSLRVITCGLLDEYMALVLELAQHWSVLPFAFDWRLDIDDSANVLNDAIRAWAGTEPVHIVAHSMGGLVSRRFIQLHHDTWQGMKDPNGMRRGGRLVMLGTPNRGSFAIPFVLTGEEKMVRYLKTVDLTHNLAEVLQITNTFPGSYQMMPTPKLEFGDDRNKLFAQNTWGTFPVAQANLDRGRNFQEALHAVVDPERLIYVAGYDQDTPYRIRVDGPGRFSYQQTRDGDGRVPHELGLLPDVATFYVREKHGSLPSNDLVLAGIDELLSKGTTSRLETQRPSTRAIKSARWQKSSEIAPIAPAVSIVTATRGGPSSIAQLSAEVRAGIEADMVEEFVGAKRTPMPAEAGRDATKVDAIPMVKHRRAPVRLEVMWADITEVDGDVFVAGHYQGVEPFAGELALDRAVSGVLNQESIDRAGLVITSHTRRGLLRGCVGDVNFFPWANSRKTVAIAGMGNPGSFGRKELQHLARSLAESVSALPNVHTVNMLLIGSGTGNLRVPVALSSLLAGLTDALGEGIPNNSIQLIRIVERDWKRSRSIAKGLRAVKAAAHAGQLSGIAISDSVVDGKGGDVRDDTALSTVLAVTAKHTRAAKGRSARALLADILRAAPSQPPWRERCEKVLETLGKDTGADVLAIVERMNFGWLPDPVDEAPVPTRLSFIREEGGVRAAAISDTAVVPERKMPLDWSLVEQIIERLTDPEVGATDSVTDDASFDDVSMLAARLLIPRDFRPAVAMSSSLVIEVDRDTARIQWECVGKFSETREQMMPLALAGPLARQLRTSYSPPPSRVAQPGPLLRALVIGDPGDPERGHSLEGARHEALEVAKLLSEKYDVEVDLLVGAKNAPRTGEIAGIRPATVFEVLRLLSKNTYDILHYAGHADFDPASPERAGWLFGDGFFTSRELASVEQVPALVIANACLSGLTSNVRAAAAEKSGLRGADDDLLPGLVDEFFLRGVRNYVGTAWPISDVGAIFFAKTLYAVLLDPATVADDCSLGNALLVARKALRQQDADFGALWAAYQHYGDPCFSVRRSSVSAAATANRAEVKPSVKAPRRDTARAKAATKRKVSTSKASKLKTTGIRGKPAQTKAGKGRKS